MSPVGTHTCVVTWIMVMDSGAHLAPGEVFFRTTNKSSPNGCSLSQLATPPSHYEYMYRLPNATRRTTYIRSIRPKPPPGATAGAAPGA